MRVCLIIFDCFPWFARLVCRSSRPAMPYSGSTYTTCYRSGTSAMPVPLPWQAYRNGRMWYRRHNCPAWPRQARPLSSVPLSSILLQI